MASEVLHEAGADGFDLDEGPTSSASWLDDDSISPALAQNANLVAAAKAIEANVLRDHGDSETTTAQSRAASLRRFVFSPPLGAIRAATRLQDMALLAAAFFLAAPNEEHVAKWPKALAYALDRVVSGDGDSDMAKLLRGMSALLAFHHARSPAFGQRFLNHSGLRVLEDIRRKSAEPVLRDEATRSIAILTKRLSDKSPLVEDELEIEGWMGRRELTRRPSPTSSPRTSPPRPSAKAPLSPVRPAPAAAPPKTDDVDGTQAPPEPPKTRKPPPPPPWPPPQRDASASPPPPPPRDYDPERAAAAAVVGAEAPSRPSSDGGSLDATLKAAGLDASHLAILKNEAIGLSDLLEALREGDVFDLLKEAGLKAGERTKLVRELKKRAAHAIDADDL